jgi:hypothetical protein
MKALFRMTKSALWEISIKLIVQIRFLLSAVGAILRYPEIWLFIAVKYRTAV